MGDKNKQAKPFAAVVPAPFGAVGVVSQGLYLEIVLLPESHEPIVSENKTVARVVEQIEAYLVNANNSFNLPMMLRGTPFQKMVWQEIMGIPKGKVLTYDAIAKKINSGARAVANACGENSLPLVIPCHRVVAQNGIGGFMQGDPNGLKIKEWLLQHEGVKV
jgi:methylated-DNA-[protein]-cysteine S-methyltransferase